MGKDDFIWLQRWYREHCDGDWEHGSGISIATLDNPGWYISINLEGTELEKEKFDEINIDRSEDNWVFCLVKNKKFEGHSGCENFSEVLRIFRNWVEKCSV